MKPKIKEGDFYKVINNAIKENRHVDYLKEVLKKYEEYKKEFDKIFLEIPRKEFIYTFRIDFISDRPLWREVEILGEQTFKSLAEIIIKSMDWKNDHMHGFELVGKNNRPDPLFTASSLAFFAPYWEDDPHPFYKSNEIHIYDIDYAQQPRFKFTFDYGDGHQFNIKYKSTRELKEKEKEKIKKFPRITDQRGVAPEQYPEYE